MASELDQDIFADALALPADERARLASALLQSLDESSDTEAADAWLTEVERRAREVESGSVSLENWEDVRARLSSRWRRQR